METTKKATTATKVTKAKKATKAKKTKKAKKAKTKQVQQVKKVKKAKKAKEVKKAKQATTAKTGQRRDTTGTRRQGGVTGEVAETAVARGDGRSTRGGGESGKGKWKGSDACTVPACTGEPGARA